MQEIDFVTLMNIELPRGSYELQFGLEIYSFSFSFKFSGRLKKLVLHQDSDILQSWVDVYLETF